MLNLYSYAPLFTGVLREPRRPRRRTSSTRTTRPSELYKEGAKRGSIDPCFPSKVGIAHVHNLLSSSTRSEPLDYIFFPMIDVLPSPLVGTRGEQRVPDRRADAARP